MYALGSYFFAPSGIASILFPTLGLPAGDDFLVNNEYPDFRKTYGALVARPQWFDTANHEWICWPEDANRTQLSGENGDGKLGDLPIHLFVAQSSTAFDDWHQTQEVGWISSDSKTTLLPDATHGFILGTKYTAQLVEAIEDLMSRPV